MNFGLLIEWIKPIALIVPIIISIFTIYSLIYEYQKSDLFIQKIFSSTTAVALYKLFRSIINLLISILLSVCLYIYVIARSNMSIPEFFKELDKKPNDKLILGFYFFFFIGIFLILVINIPTLFSFIFPNRLKIKKTNFYLLSQELNLNNLPYNTKLFFVSRINNEAVLLCCDFKNETIRITYPINELSKRKIFYEKKLSFWQELKELNNFFLNSTKKEKYYFLLPIPLILLPYILMSIIIKDYYALISITITIFFAYLLMLSPSICTYLKNFSSKKSN